MSQQYRVQLYSKKNFLIQLHGSICWDCKVEFPEYKLTIDHMIPRSEHGTNDIENLQLLCVPCHRNKCKHEGILGKLPIFAFRLRFKKKKYGKLKVVKLPRKNNDRIGRKKRRLILRQYREFLRNNTS